MSQYSTTYIGIIVIVLGWVGLSDLVTSENVATIVNNVLELVGVITAIIGRYRAGGVSFLGFKKTV